MVVVRGADVAGVGGCGVGAVLGEIPLFGPGAGSAASAGMTDLFGAGMTEVEAEMTGKGARGVTGEGCDG